ELVVLALMAEKLVLEAFEQDLQRFTEHAVAIATVAAPERDLAAAARTAPDPDLDAAVAQPVDHADLFEQTDRLIERQHVHERADLQALCALRGRGQKHRLIGCEAQR